MNDPTERNKMQVLREDSGKTFLLKLVILPLFFYSIVDFNNKTSVIVCIIATIVVFIIPPLRNFGFSPTFESIDEQGLYLSTFWGKRKKFLKWSDVRFDIKGKKIYLRESHIENNYIFILGSFVALDNIEVIMKYLNTDHPDFKNLAEFWNDYKNNKSSH